MAKDSGFRFTTVTAEVLDARERVIHEHGRLRGHLFALQAIARDVALDGSREDELRDGVRRLCVEMIRHLETEEQLLVRLLGTDRPERLERVQAEHALQRRLLGRTLERSVASTAPVELALVTNEVVLTLLRDMREEERELVADDEGPLGGPVSGSVRVGAPVTAAAKEPEDAFGRRAG